ncbi:hypothetical protein [Paenibacillus illinoisensis]|uniref:hypothetical protein n=1 Tax=Paenibacillus illinoisensis TaxID=59845 RepID=UPI000FDBE7EF|nr:hypothetical protein [Paenibacillus illinoisensis]
MANRYANLVGSKRISEDFNNINIGFDRVQAEMDTKGTPADAQAKADAAKAAAIASAAASLTAHKQRGADEHPAASGNAAGFMSAADKKKSDASTSAATPDTLMQRDAEGRAKVAAPAAADDIARKTETDAVQANLDSHAADTDIHVTAEDHAKLDGIAEGAEVNQNAFAKVNDVEAAAPSDALQITGGTGITVTTDPASKKLTVTATGEATPGAHASSHITGGSDVIPDAVIGGASGLMSGADAKFVREDGETKAGAQAKADEVKTYVDGRLDISERSAVTLQPGVQVLQAEQEAPFSLSGLKGRTLVNLLGREGGCEAIGNWKTFQTSNALDSSNKTSGVNGFKITVSAGFTVGSIYQSSYPFKAGKYYLLMADVKNGNAIGLRTNISSGGPTAINYTDTKFGPQYVKYNPTTDNAANINISVEGAAGTYGYVDSIRLYELSATEYAALDSMTLEQISSKYPYVDSVQPVRNPYAIRYGENLLPPFYEAEIATGVNLTSPYSLSFSLTGSSVNVARYWVPVVEGETYTLTPGLVNGDNFQVIGFADDKSTITMNSLGVVRDAITFTVPSGSGTKYLRLTLISGSLTGIMVVDNPMLNIGTTAKPFKPREDAMLALQTDLYADPLTGANADEVFEKDGQYFKLAKWRKGTLDGSLVYAYSSSNSSTGYKAVYVEGVYNDAVSRSAIVAKFDGKVLNLNASLTASDIQNGIVVGNPTRLFLTISNANSGWGDSYNPTADEIKAYFMGWKMYQEGNRETPYTSGTKQWFKINRPADSSVSSIPTDTYSEWTPYQLVYQLATPTVEPITSEGQLTLNEGNNQVEVGTGIVLREPNTAGLYSNTYYLNDTVYGKPLKYKVLDILAIFRNNQRDYKWTIYSGNNQYGNKKASLASDKYDPSVTYTVTYLMLDKSPIVPIFGSVAENEKALFTDLVQDVQQANARISVVESKKAEKDSPAWITPTLLNGWVNFSNGFSPAGYYKDSSGYVHIRGLIKSGFGGAFFMLPKGYRPAHALAISTISAANAAGDGALPASINVFPDGTVITAVNFQSGFMSLEGISFLAEQ